MAAGRAGGSGLQGQAPQERRGWTDVSGSEKSAGGEAPRRQSVGQRGVAAVDNGSGGAVTPGGALAAAAQQDRREVGGQAEGAACGVSPRGRCDHRLRGRGGGGRGRRPLLVKYPSRAPKAPLPLTSARPTRQAAAPPVRLATAATARPQPSCSFPLYGVGPPPVPHPFPPPTTPPPSSCSTRPASGEHASRWQAHTPPHPLRAPPARDGAPQGERGTVRPSGGPLRRRGSDRGSSTWRRGWARGRRPGRRGNFTPRPAHASAPPPARPGAPPRPPRENPPRVLRARSPGHAPGRAQTLTH